MVGQVGKQGSVEAVMAAVQSRAEAPIAAKSTPYNVDGAERNAGVVDLFLKRFQDYGAFPEVQWGRNQAWTILTQPMGTAELFGPERWRAVASLGLGPFIAPFMRGLVEDATEGLSRRDWNAEARALAKGFAPLAFSDQDIATMAVDLRKGAEAELRFLQENAGMKPFDVRAFLMALLQRMSDGMEPLLRIQEGLQDVR